MKSELEDKKIKELFLELRRAEERAAPAFDQIWAAASSRVASSRWRGYFLRVTAAAALVVGLGVATTLLLNHPASDSRTLATVGGTVESPELPWRSAVLISQWRAPTDFLLESPAARLVQSEGANDSVETISPPQKN